MVRSALDDHLPEATRAVIVMASDKGRFGRFGKIMQAWRSPSGTRPEARKQSIRKYIYAFVAVAPALGLMTGLKLLCKPLE